MVAFYCLEWFGAWRSDWAQTFRKSVCGWQAFFLRIFILNFAAQAATRGQISAGAMPAGISVCLCKADPYSRAPFFPNDLSPSRAQDFFRLGAPRFSAANLRFY